MTNERIWIMGLKNWKFSRRMTHHLKYFILLIWVWGNSLKNVLNYCGCFAQDLQTQYLRFCTYILYANTVSIIIQNWGNRLKNICGGILVIDQLSRNSLLKWIWKYLDASDHFKGSGMKQATSDKNNQCNMESIRLVCAHNWQLLFSICFLLETL